MRPKTVVEFRRPRTREVLVEDFYDKVTRRYHRNQPVTPIQAMIEAAPFEHVEESLMELMDRLEPIREAIDEKTGILDDREQWIIEAIFFRRISFRDLAEEVPWSTTHLHRLKNEALAKLRYHLADVYTTTEEYE